MEPSWQTSLEDLIWGLWLSAWKRHHHDPVQASISLTIKGVPVMDFPDDQTVDAVLTFSDAFGDKVPDPGQVVWSVDDATLASVTVDPADENKAFVKALAGAGTFRVEAVCAGVSVISSPLNITPGAAVSGAIALTLEPKA